MGGPILLVGVTGPHPSPRVLGSYPMGGSQGSHPSPRGLALHPDPGHGGPHPSPGTNRPQGTVLGPGPGHPCGLRGARCHGAGTTPCWVQLSPRWHRTEQVRVPAVVRPVGRDRRPGPARGRARGCGAGPAQATRIRGTRAALRGLPGISCARPRGRQLSLARHGSVRHGTAPLRGWAGWGPHPHPIAGGPVPGALRCLSLIHI